MTGGLHLFRLGVFTCRQDSTRMKENQNIEWKESWRDEYLKWICGFANADGAVLDIGRNDRGVVVGLPDAKKLLEELANKKWTLKRLLGKHPSRPFNPLIADAFFRAGYIESWGRGIEKINRACREHGISAPESNETIRHVGSTKAGHWEVLK
jgi:predicted HTH transcriptional regulator